MSKGGSTSGLGRRVARLTRKLLKRATGGGKVSPERAQRIRREVADRVASHLLEELAAEDPFYNVEYDETLAKVLRRGVRKFARKQALKSIAVEEEGGKARLEFRRADLPDGWEIYRTVSDAVDEIFD
ncbi:hypothetical protein AKJ58_01275 [candidate division MSBL1 archaeon SCGC-AAA385D11]|uniref:Uncharacterized protein n=1 Tax=candidate division MSBL1 archaeon SCGC-AAA385D11 TaxID=1698286 RepID=A0A133VNF8_9EURY|nr:hypothetical protein AKJ58_01275 [candidate division MSBL1 archaeon SCGC-AAA385D11]